MCINNNSVCEKWLVSCSVQIQNLNSEFVHYTANKSLFTNRILVLLEHNKDFHYIHVDMPNHWRPTFQNNNTHSKVFWPHLFLLSIQKSLQIKEYFLVGLQDALFYSGFTGAAHLPSRAQRYPNWSVFMAWVQCTIALLFTVLHYFSFYLGQLLHSTTVLPNCTWL